MSVPTIPPYISFGKLMEMLRQHGLSITQSQTVSHSLVIIRLRRNRGTGVTAPHLLMISPVAPPDDNDHSEYQIDTSYELPLIRNALELRREDGWPDDKFFRYL
jgi:hypothetical protein